MGCLLYVPGLGMCPYWESNLQPFGALNEAPTNTARAPSPISWLLSTAVMAEGANGPGSLGLPPHCGMGWGGGLCSI